LGEDTLNRSELVEDRTLEASESPVFGKIDPEVLEKIRKAHELGMTITEAIVYANVDENRLRKLWQQLGLSSHYSYGWRNEISPSSKQEEVLKTSCRFNMAVEEIAELPEFWSEKLATISKMLRKLNLQPKYVAENIHDVPKGYWEKLFKAPSQCQFFETQQ